MKEEPNVVREARGKKSNPEILVALIRRNKEETTEEMKDLLKPEEPKVKEEPNVLEQPEVSSKQKYKTNKMYKINLK
ncbi:hypothetical protein ACT7DH_03790 [Bacillus pacificus]